MRFTALSRERARGRLPLSAPETIPPPEVTVEIEAMPPDPDESIGVTRKQAPRRETTDEDAPVPSWRIVARIVAATVVVMLVVIFWWVRR